MADSKKPKPTPFSERVAPDERAPFFVQTIYSSYQERLLKNPRFSLRAYSRLLGISPSWLLRVLRNERMPSVSTLDKIAQKLGWTKSVRDLAMREVLASVGSRKMKSIPRELEPDERSDETWVDEKQFSAIADRISLAVLQLPEVEGFVFTAENVARALGISLPKAEAAIHRLRLSGNLELGPDGAYRKAHAWLHADGRSATTGAHQRLVQDFLALASGHVAATPSSERLNYWGMYAIDPDEIPKVKPLIERFMIDLESLLAGRARKRVYAAGFFLCPATDEGSTGPG